MTCLWIEEVKMNLSKKDLAILDKFEFEVPPVGIKFFPTRPDQLERLNGRMALCEMLKKAQEGNAFYADLENHTCDAGPYVLGQAEAPEPFISGRFGAGLKIFGEPRSGGRLYQYIPRILKGTVHSVVFSPVSKLTFDPDVLVLLTKTQQTEIILRAMSYRTGEMWSSKLSAAIGCAWIFVYPYI